MRQQPNNRRRTGSAIRRWSCALTLAALCIFSGANALAAQSRAGQKRVSIDMTDARLADVLGEIKTQTGVNFISNADDLNNARRVDAVFADATVQTVLDGVMRGQDLSYKFSDDYVVISHRQVSASMQAPVAAAAPQTQNVTGRVTDGAGEPLIGAMVAVRGGSAVAITDAAGVYYLSAAPGSTLDVSLLGYSAVSAEVTGGTLDVILTEDINRLEEVVVLGYTTVRRAELTGSVVTVGSESLTENTTPDLGSMLQGKVAGMMVTNNSGQPGAEASVLIRGVGTITAGQAPLYVVDGIPGGTYNPNDIETLTVLKDVAATAIYGADGANGVIVITTKQGRRNQAPEFTLRYNAAVTQPMFGRFRMMTGEELYNYWELADLPNFKVLYPETLKQRNFDWFGNTFGNASAQELYASVTGGTDLTTYMLSLNHFTQDGAIEGTGYKRSSLRMNFST
ncbi:MAG: TonB-dependent receptor plug domain-containing protein, partial [Alistipes sp.]|nr:TonB-dependent receptor plug domain-containing protein [Alistipes sp.]